MNIMWKCPACETINNEERCVICGEPKPLYEEPPVQAAHPPYETVGEATYSPALAAKRGMKKLSYEVTPVIIKEPGTKPAPAKSADSYKEMGISPALAAKKAAKSTATMPPKMEYKAPEIVSGDMLKKVAMVLIPIAVLVLVTWLGFAVNNAKSNPETPVKIFAQCIDDTIDSEEFIRAYPKPIQTLYLMDKSDLYEVNELHNSVRGEESVELRVVSKIKCDSYELYNMEEKLNNDIERLYARSGTSWSRWVDVEEGYILSVKSTVEDDYYDKGTSFITLNAYKIDGEWYIDYFNELLYIY